MKKHFPLLLIFIPWIALFSKSQLIFQDSILDLLGMSFFIILVYILAYHFKKDRFLCLGFAFLILCSLINQKIIDATNIHPISTFYLKYPISIIIAIGGFILYLLLQKQMRKRWFLWIFELASISIYLILFKLGIDPNGQGTTAWIRLWNTTFQLTDLIKVFALFFYANLFTTTTNQKKIWLYSHIFLGTQLIGSILIKEMGSCLILCLLHYGFIVFFLKKSIGKTIYILTIPTLLFFMIALAIYIYPNIRNISFLQPFPYAISLISKIYHRFMPLFQIGFEANGAGYQVAQSRQIIQQATWFGHTTPIHLPVPSSDMAFVSFLHYYGYGLVTLFGLTYITLFCKVYSHMRHHIKTDYIYQLFFGVCIFIFTQACLVIFANLNLLPIMGLPIPFLSKGYTFFTISLFMVFIMLYHTQQKR